MKLSKSKTMTNPGYERRLQKRAEARAMAAMTGAFGFGQIVGPVFAGALSDRLGGFLVPSAIAAAGLVLAAWLATWRSRPAN